MHIPEFLAQLVGLAPVILLLQAGLGRLGMHWWPFQHFNFKPDILVCGRSLGNGQPLSAVLTTQAIGKFVV